MKKRGVTMPNKQQPRLAGRGSYSEAFINFLDTSYDKAENKSILIEYATGVYPAMCVALAKAKLVQIENGGAIWG